MLVIRSLNAHTCQILQPTTSVVEDTAKLLEQAKSLKPHQTAVVILEKYTDSSIGNQFRDRGTDWFVELRGLGFEHIYFLQGRNVSDPEGLPTIYHYD